MKDHAYVYLANSDVFVMAYLASLGCKRPGPMSHPLERCPKQATAFFSNLAAENGYQLNDPKWQDYLSEMYWESDTLDW